MGRSVFWSFPVIISDLATSDDMTVTDDLAVGDDMAVTGKATVGETLTVTGAVNFLANVECGNAVSDSVGFYGVGPVSQRRSASQAAVTTLTGTASTTNLAAKLNALIVYCMRVRSDLIAIGAIKGGA
jgi:hypothetical protein